MPFEFESRGFLTSLGPKITPPPDLELIKRQQPQNFVGYTSIDSLWSPITCVSGATFVESKPFGSSLPGYAGCCSGPCMLPTSCVGNTLYYSNAYSTPCGLGSSCVSGLIATSEGVELEGDLYLGCANNYPQNWFAYKTTPAANSSRNLIGTTTTTSSHTTPSNSNTNSSSVITITPSAVPLSNHNSLSGAAIAGTVIGPICGVALILGLAFLFIRRSRSKLATADPSSNVQSVPQDWNPGSAPFGGYVENKPELPATNSWNPPPMSMPPA